MAAGQVFSSVSLVQSGMLVLHEIVNTGKICVFPGVVLDFSCSTRVSTLCNTLAVSLYEERRFFFPVSDTKDLVRRVYNFIS